MLKFLFGDRSPKTIPQQLYGSVMAQSREPYLFSGFGVPDTVMGRFDMLALHVFMFARRLRTESGETARNLNQEVFDLFVADIERALRELGIGDTTVPKRKKKLVRSFYGQIDDFDQPIETGDFALLRERVHGRYLAGGNEEGAELITAYILNALETLEGQPFQEILRGELIWPRPGS